jgi:HD-GYP domain-containing protein (c-di-GMP phosphodiesterase class II)
MAYQSKLSSPLNRGASAEQDTARLVRAIDAYYANLNQAVRENLAYVEVPLPLFIVERMPDVTIYLLPSGPGAPKVFRPAGMYMSQVEFDTLDTNGAQTLLVSRAECSPFTTYVEDLLTSLPPSSAMADERKVTLLRTNAIGVITDIMNSPTPENIEKGVKCVTGFVYVLMKDPRAYGTLLSLSSHDHYTLQHSVGVAANAIILAHKHGIKDEKALIEVGVGSLMHDIGKTKVDSAIINKQGPLDESEWAQMKLHSRHGYEIIKDNNSIGPRAKLAILQHHEEPAGTGYPLGLKNEQIDLYAKIVTLADIYNALTTNRSYSAARPPFEAFKLIKEKLMHKVDDKLFQSLVLVYGTKAP